MSSILSREQGSKPLCGSLLQNKRKSIQIPSCSYRSCIFTFSVWQSPISALTRETELFHKQESDSAVHVTQGLLGFKLPEDRPGVCAVHSVSCLHYTVLQAWWASGDATLCRENHSKRTVQAASPLTV